MRVYFVRHGKTQANENGFFPNHNEPLSQKGIQEATFICSRFAHTDIDLLVSSSMPRARATAEIILTNKEGVPHTTLQDLDELNRSSRLYEKDRNDPHAQELLSTWWQKNKTEDHAEIGGESFEAFKSRAKSALQFLEDSEKESVVVVGHSFILRMLAGLILFDDKLTTELFEDISFNLKLNNAGISIAEYTKENGWKLLTWNDQAHLADPQ